MRTDKKRVMDEQGAAMIVAVVVSMVILVMTLLLLLTTYSLYRDSQNRTGQIRCRELAASMGQTLEAELLQPQDGTGEGLGSYLREQLGQGDWQPFDAKQEEAHERYFLLEIPSGYEELADRVMLSIYWMDDGDGAPVMVNLTLRVEQGEEAYVWQQSFGIREDGTDRWSFYKAYGDGTAMDNASGEGGDS